MLVYQPYERFDPSSPPHDQSLLGKPPVSHTTSSSQRSGMTAVLTGQWMARQYASQIGGKATQKERFSCPSTTATRADWMRCKG